MGSLGYDRRTHTNLDSSNVLLVHTQEKALLPAGGIASLKLKNLSPSTLGVDGQTRTLTTLVHFSYACSGSH